MAVSWMPLGSVESGLHSVSYDHVLTEEPQSSNESESAVRNEPHLSSLSLGKLRSLQCARISDTLRTLSRIAEEPRGLSLLHSFTDDKSLFFGSGI